MRVYLPATAADLSAPGVSARRAHAVTAALAAALPEEDEEGLEVSASLCAADASVELLAAGGPGLADRRVVLAADLDPEEVRELEVGGDVLPGTVEVLGEVDWERVAALLVDEAAAEADVALARTGDEEAFERTAEADLLWYYASERKALAAELARG